MTGTKSTDNSQMGNSFAPLAASAPTSHASNLSKSARKRQRKRQKALSNPPLDSSQQIAPTVEGSPETKPTTAQNTAPHKLTPRNTPEKVPLSTTPTSSSTPMVGKCASVKAIRLTNVTKATPDGSNSKLRITKSSPSSKAPVAMANALSYSNILQASSPPLGTSADYRSRANGSSSQPKSPEASFGAPRVISLPNGSSVLNHMNKHDPVTGAPESPPTKFKGNNKKGLKDFTGPAPQLNTVQYHGPTWASVAASPSNSGSDSEDASLKSQKILSPTSTLDKSSTSHDNSLAEKTPGSGELLTATMVKMTKVNAGLASKNIRLAATSNGRGSAPRFTSNAMRHSAAPVIAHSPANGPNTSPPAIGNKSSMKMGIYTQSIKGRPSVLRLTSPALKKETPNETLKSKETAAGNKGGASVKTTSSARKLSASAAVQDPTVTQPLDDLRLMCRDHRKSLLQGPLIKVFVGQACAYNIPKRAAMAASSVLNEYFVTDPSALSYEFTDVKPQIEAVRYLLYKWLKENCRDKDVAEQVPCRNTFRENVAVLQAATLLGMERYTKNILHYHLNYLRNIVPEYHEVITVMELRASDRDPLFTNMVMHLTHTKYKGRIPDPEVFSSFLEQYPTLKAAIDETNAFYQEKSRRSYEQRLEERDRQQAAYDAAHRVLNGNGGVRVVSSKEASAVLEC